MVTVAIANENTCTMVSGLFLNVEIPKVVILMYIIPIEDKTATKVEIIAQTKLTLAQIVLNSAITRFTTKL